jgi:TonB-linked SusC/RagA family outer membrane protein
LDFTILYGFEQRKNDYTDATSSVFINDILGYNSLQSGSSELQKTYSGAWEEKSLYSMARFFYSLRDKYMVTATVRRDGFSGFSEKNKFGVFPSFALGWVASEEPFFKDIYDIMNYLKVRVSYGTIGNRTVGRYQTLAKVSGDFRYVDASGTPVYAKSISSIASSNLKWETTTGFNAGIDFGLFNSKLTGQIEYYNNDTRDLLYSVDIPSIGRFQKFPDNLGRIHNHGIEITLSSINIKKNSFSWKSDFSFSRNRDELKELLGFDNNGDGKEDDLISEGLFIGHPLSVAYHYQVTGELYQLGDDIPSTADIGSQVIVDQNNDGEIDPDNDKVILGYKEPSYRFSITNQFTYKDWSLSVFINSIQGGNDYYYAMDNIHYQTLGSGFSNSEGAEQHYQLNFPKGLDYWLPENPNAKYPRIGTAISSNLLATAWAQRSFVRLQDVSLSYNFNSDLLDKIKVDNLRLFISGQNLFTWTKWSGWDPETGEGINRTGRPVLRSYTFGLNLEF